MIPSYHRGRLARSIRLKRCEGGLRRRPFPVGTMARPMLGSRRAHISLNAPQLRRLRVIHSQREGHFLGHPRSSLHRVLFFHFPHSPFSSFPFQSRWPYYPYPFFSLLPFFFFFFLFSFFFFLFFLGP